MAALDGFEGFLFEPYSFLSLTVAIYDWHIPVVLTQRCIPLPNSLFHIIVFFFLLSLFWMYIFVTLMIKTRLYTPLPPVLVKEKNT
jgi:hypothetical protein